MSTSFQCSLLATLPSLVRLNIIHIAEISETEQYSTNMIIQHHLNAISFPQGNKTHSVAKLNKQ